MCLNSRIIVNPTYIQLTGFGQYPFYSLNGHDGMYRRNPLDEFNYKLFGPRRNGVTKENMDNFYAYDPCSGETLPLYIEVPCGKCPACVMSKRTEVKSRMLLEQYGNENPPIFLTLTYAPEFLPEGNNVSVKDVQLFMKRLRSYMEYHYPNFSKFRYMCFSEYGDPNKTWRPHYHIILFGTHIGNESPRAITHFEKECRKCWNKGIVWAVLCDTGCFNYASKYVCKGSNVPPGCKPNFRLSSRRNGGIGIPTIETDESLYLEILRSPHPLIKLKVMGKVFDVFIPKAIRERLFRSPRNLIPVKMQKQYKRFVWLSALFTTAQVDFPEFKDHLQTYNRLHGETVFPDDMIPVEIYDKFGPLNICPAKVSVPSWLRSSRFWTVSDVSVYIEEYLTLYKNLKNFQIDLDNLYEMQYLRSTKLRDWTLSLVRFHENGPDRDPFLCAQFNAILVESQSSKDGQ